MITYTGEAIFPDTHPHHEDESPSLASIGIGLSRIPRFAGQTKKWYSVLGHTFTVADLVLPEFKIHALLHDAPEAIVADVPSTWKTREAEIAEQELMWRISDNFGVTYPWSQEIMTAVKIADIAALAAEAHVLGHEAAEKYWPEKELDPRAVNLTRMNLEIYGSLIEPSIAAGVYEKAVSVCLAYAV